jgi:hypothetical protein
MSQYFRILNYTAMTLHLGEGLMKGLACVVAERSGSVAHYGVIGPMKYGRIISWSSCSTM